MKVCFCPEETGGPAVKCKNTDCPISLYRPMCRKFIVSNLKFPIIGIVPTVKGYLSSKKTHPKTKDITTTQALPLKRTHGLSTFKESASVLSP